MSKEREQLKLCAEAFALHNKCPNLTGDINELLAQPEQTEHWKETLIEHFQSAFDSEMYRTDEGEELILLEDAICYVEEFAPPKREPLSDEEIYEIFSKNEWNKFIELARAIEKAHGIGGGE